MSALIPFAPRQLGAATVQTVNGRDLHAFLGITRDYATWIKTWLKRAHLIQDRDYVVSYAEVENPKRRGKKALGGRPSTDYFLTFDAAKCIGMMSGTAKGDEVRAYFLRCEQDALTKTAVPQVRDPAIQMLIDMAVHLDEARALAIEARVEAAQANTKVEQMLHEQAWMTIHQYVIQHDLERQMPESLQRAYATHLIGYCTQNGYRIYPQPVAYQRWEDENAYYVGALKATLEPWLTRRYAQTDLHLIRPQAGD